MLIALLLHVALVVPPTRTVSPGIIRGAVAEAAAVWAPYSVAVEAACGRAGRGTVLTVVPIETRHSAAMPP
jgi:hypothetical protein